MNEWTFKVSSDSNWTFQLNSGVISLLQLPGFPNSFEEGKYLRATSDATEWSSEGIILKVDSLPAIDNEGNVVYNKQDKHLYLYKEE